MAKKRKRKAKPCSCGGKCDPCKLATKADTEALKARASRLVKNKQGKLVSKRSKTQDAACSQAMSQWKTSGMTPTVAATLGKCRAKARLLREGATRREMGQEARAQAMESRANRGGPLTAKDRMARAKQLRSERASAPRNRAKLPEIEVSLQNGREATTFRTTRPWMERHGLTTAAEARSTALSRMKRAKELRAQRKAGGVSKAPAANTNANARTATPKAEGRGTPERQTTAMFIREGRQIAREAGIPRIKIRSDVNMRASAGFIGLGKKQGIRVNPKSAHAIASGKDRVDDPNERIYAWQSGATPRERARIVMAHEVGHAVDEKQMFAEKPDLQAAIRNSKTFNKERDYRGISQYGRSHPSEMFAELHALHVTKRRGEIPLELAKAYKQAASESRLTRARELRAQRSARVASASQQPRFSLSSSPPPAPKPQRIERSYDALGRALLGREKWTARDADRAVHYAQFMDDRDAASQLSWQAHEFRHISVNKTLTSRNKQKESRDMSGIGKGRATSRAIRVSQKLSASATPGATAGGMRGTVTNAQPAAPSLREQAERARQAKGRAKTGPSITVKKEDTFGHSRYVIDDVNTGLNIAKGEFGGNKGAIVRAARMIERHGLHSMPGETAKQAVDRMGKKVRRAVQIQRAIEAVQKRKPR